jgi:hypothetical protein
MKRWLLVSEIIVPGGSSWRWTWGDMSLTSFFLNHSQFANNVMEPDAISGA